MVSARDATEHAAALPGDGLALQDSLLQERHIQNPAQGMRLSPGTADRRIAAGARQSGN